MAHFRSWSSLVVLPLLVGVAMSAAAMDNLNTTVQVGKVNINRTFQCGEENTNSTYQEGKVNINKTIQACPKGGGGRGQGGGNAAKPPDPPKAEPALAANGQRPRR